ncbi:KIAA1191 [Phyllostomus discolor]|uniref:Putative monooxygenase p33MONOX n=1 Tax=Phyllostomus discolor TaxID=89673 RepID=A0A833YVX9_9CHIR|nr:KIAA1191 [Phyllostomus discolor]
MDSGGRDKDRASADKWSLFGPRPLQKSDAAGLAVQPYRGAQKPSPMELMQAAQDGRPGGRREETAATHPQSQTPGPECAHTHRLLALSLPATGQRVPRARSTVTLAPT